MSSKDKIKSFLICKGQAYNYELAGLLEGQPGQLSWGQRVRDLRKEFAKEGIEIACTEERPGVYLYKLIKQQSTYKEIGKQLAFI